jgi:hypothetical protein
VARLLAQRPSLAETRAHRIIGGSRLPPLDLDGSGGNRDSIVYFNSSFSD